MKCSNCGKETLESFGEAPSVLCESCWGEAWGDMHDEPTTKKKNDNLIIYFAIASPFVGALFGLAFGYTAGMYILIPVAFWSIIGCVASIIFFIAHYTQK